MPDLASVNGTITAPADAVVSIDDRGLLFGDAVYEALRVYGGRPFALDRHQARLRRSLTELRFNGVDIDAIGRDVVALIERSGLREATVYYQVSRGVHPRDHTPPKDLTPTVLITVRGLQRAKRPDRERGVGVIAVQDTRWGRVDIKTTNLLPNALARWQASEAGCYEAVLLDGEIVREGCSTSVLAARGGVIMAPRQGPWILPSITRAIAEELCRKEGIAVEERDFTLDEMLTAEEILLLGSTTEIIGVVQVDGGSAGSGQVGPITRRLAELYRAHIAESLGIPIEDVI